MRKKITHYKIDVTVAVLKISDNSEHAVMKGHLKKQKTKNKTNKKEKKKHAVKFWTVLYLRADFSNVTNTDMKRKYFA